METACFKALQPYCGRGRITVGISIHVEHRAASGIGMQIRATAELHRLTDAFTSCGSKLTWRAGNRVWHGGKKPWCMCRAFWSGCGRKHAAVNNLL